MSNVSISQLSTTTSFAAGDYVPVASSALGVTAKTTGAQILAFVEANFADPDFTVTLSAPVTGFNQVVSGTTNQWLIWSPAGTLATGTLTLPAVADCFDGMIVQVTCSQVITALTVTAGAGTTVAGAPTALGVNGFFTLRYNVTLLKWLCTAQSLGSIATVGNLTITGDILDGNGNELINFTSTASAVNEVAVVNAATGDKPTIAATGGDTNVGLLVTTKGTGSLQLTSPTGAILAGAASLDVDTTGAIDIESSAGNVGLVATTGVATVQGSTVVNVIATAGNVNIDAVGAAADVNVTAGDDLNVTVTGDVVATAGSVTLTSATITLVGTVEGATAFRTITSTVAALPAASAFNVGQRRYVTNSNVAYTAGIGAVVAGGGAFVVPVFSNGVAWLIG